ncbi:nucleolar and spindle-associated protein 1-like isoform X2 [Sinocyclocheilus grahami]|uniref:nucleolar and spindle-associated protein 1-like isoform X2 n=1 Tax=Sinocyclocheilus grahami TaxID=75366 RepID=UPI0007AC7796|nr:PREDICTED: nucleolar and spindle-associated protein 1-like isoform X2 [Sinocyclocheilus grahami]
MEIIHNMDLDSLKYAELQRLAKEAGLKANMKAEKLLKALKEHFSKHQQQTSENGNDAATADAHDAVLAVDEQGAHTVRFVTERRGKGRTAKRKLNDSSPVTAQTEEKPGKEESRRGSKRRKVSSAEDTQTPGQPETSTKEDPVEKGLESGETNLDSEDAPAEPSVKGVGRRTVGKIPRLEGLMKRKPALRPTTPNFKKLHEAHFNKMESIDSYVQRKNKQMEVLRNSVKKLKTVSEKALTKSVETKSQTKVPASRVPLFSPGVQEKKTLAEKRRLTQQSASKSALKDSATFRPTVLTTNKINVRFSQTTHDNEYKLSLVKTPARMSPLIPLTSTPGRKSDVHTKPELNKSVGAIKTPVTPFVFNGNNSMSVTPSMTKKNAFDLKASLSRPLAYKPHKGKLKPFGAPQENTALNKSETIPSHQKNYKQHQVQTREKRRAKHTEDRKMKKEVMLGARRGLVMA